MITHVRGFIEYIDSNEKVHYYKDVDLTAVLQPLAFTVQLPSVYGHLPSWSWSSIKKITGGGLTPSQNAHGLPKNLSRRGQEIRTTWGSDGYSSSFLHLDELMRLIPWSIVLELVLDDLAGTTAELILLVQKMVTLALGENVNPRLVYWFETED